MRVLPNTAGCHSVKEAVTTAHMARELFDTTWIKLEVIGEADTLQPDVFGLVEAARMLGEDGFEVFPYTTEDLCVADRLVEAGCKVLMPWGAPIGSARGLNNVYGLRALRAHFPDIPLVVDAGLGVPSHAAAAMELGYDAVLLNTAVAEAGDPVAMAGPSPSPSRPAAWPSRAEPLEPRDMAVPSTPVIGKAVTGRMTVLDPFYPVVPDSSWVARLVPAGARLDAAAHQGSAGRPRSAARCGRPGGLRRGTARSSSSTTTGRWRSTRAATGSISARRTSSDADVKAMRRAGISSASARTIMPSWRRASPSIPTMWRWARSGRPAEEDAVGAAGHGAARRMEEADRQPAAGGDRRAHARARAALPEASAPTSPPSSATSSTMRDPDRARPRRGSPRREEAKP